MVDPIVARTSAKVVKKTTRVALAAASSGNGGRRRRNRRWWPWVAALVAVVLLGTSTCSAIIGTVGGGSVAEAATDCGPATGDSVVPAGQVNLSGAKTRNARAIIAAAKKMGLSEREQVVGIMVAIVEAELLNIASSGNGQEESMKYPHDDVRPPNYQSVGIFQQQPNWGSIKDRMDVETSATLFFKALVKVDGYKTMPMGALAQRVQVSAYPDKYGKVEAQARRIVADNASSVNVTATAQPSGVPSGSATTEQVADEGAGTADDCGAASFDAMSCTPRADLNSDLGKFLTPDGVRVLWCGAQHSPKVKTIYTIGTRPAGTGDDHATGKAVDFMVDQYKTSAGKAVGSDLAKWMMDNAASMGVKYVIWDARIWNVQIDKTPKPLSQWRAYRDPTGTYTDTTKHLDHVHVSVFGDAATASVPVSGDWTRPLKGNYVMLSPYGMRVHPISGVSRLHAGVDLSLPIGNPVLAASAGTVSNREDPSGYGHYVVIQHSGGTQTLYGHMSRQSLSNGDKVKPGQIIGYSGNSGGSTGPHLHFEVRKNGSAGALGTPIDPVPYMVDSGAPLECAPGVTVSITLSKKGKC